jgi:hypothetical protein
MRGQALALAARYLDIKGVGVGVGVGPSAVGELASIRARHVGSEGRDETDLATDSESPGQARG